LGDDEGDDFAAGFREVLHSLIDSGIRPDATPDAVTSALQEIAAYLDSWVISSRLDGSEEWRQQMAASETAVKNHDLGEPATAGELRVRVGWRQELMATLGAFSIVEGSTNLSKERRRS
jgi:hypothetical protein